MTKEQRIHEI